MGTESDQLPGVLGAVDSGEGTEPLRELPVVVGGRDETGEGLGRTSGGGEEVRGQAPAKASPLKREFLRGALAGKVSAKDFAGWYQDILGKPYVELLEADVKPLLDAAWWIRRVG